MYPPAHCFFPLYIMFGRHIHVNTYISNSLFLPANVNTPFCEFTIIYLSIYLWHLGCFPFFFFPSLLPFFLSFSFFAIKNNVWISLEVCTCDGKDSPLPEMCRVLYISSLLTIIHIIFLWFYQFWEDGTKITYQICQVLFETQQFFVYVFWDYTVRFFFFLIDLFIYLWLRWVFVAAHGLSLVEESGSCSSLWRAGFSCCRAQALGPQASVVVARGL